MRNAAAVLFFDGGVNIAERDDIFRRPIDAVELFDLAVDVGIGFERGVFLLLIGDEVCPRGFDGGCGVFDVIAVDDELAVELDVVGVEGGVLIDDEIGGVGAVAEIDGGTDVVIFGCGRVHIERVDGGGVEFWEVELGVDVDVAGRSEFCVLCDGHARDVVIDIDIERAADAECGLFIEIFLDFVGGVILDDV